MTYKIDIKDLNTIISYSKDKMFYLNPPLFVSRVELDRGHLPTVANLEAILMFLNSKGLLTKEISLEYTNDYDDNDMTELEPR